MTYNPKTDLVSMPSQDFRDIVAIKVTAQEQAKVLSEELSASRIETAEAMTLYRLEAELNKGLSKENVRLMRENKLLHYAIYFLVASHAFR